MNLAQLGLLEQSIFVLVALALFLSFVLLSQARLTTMIHVFAWQGFLLALLTAIVAALGDNPHLYISALLTFLLKVLLIPAMLHRLIRRLELERHQERLQKQALVMMAGAALVIFSYWVVLPITHMELAHIRNVVSLSLAIVQLGMLLMVARRQVVAQVIGFMSMENGLFLAAVAATAGMPLVVELGIAFDVLVAAVLFGVFFFHIRDSIDTLDVDQLTRLSEEER
ncbi:MAG: formate hydrogenlyase [gamma proteobacterium symbiont of Bathyaustriella thionipta]|nr:formate hydrogenlyase [gamma proteobacterium symbiont of Bathyaustriella thionipta]